MMEYEACYTGKHTVLKSVPFSTMDVRAISTTFYLFIYVNRCIDVEQYLLFYAGALLM
jgi:hypothetical protein